jgi:hypothetical protein
MSPFMGVARARTVQETELQVGQVEQEPSQFQGKGGGTGTMTRVSELVDPLRVVEHREKLHDLDAGTGLPGQPQTVFENSGPVGDSVISFPRKGILFQDGLEDKG